MQHIKNKMENDGYDPDDLDVNYILSRYNFT